MTSQGSQTSGSPLAVLGFLALLVAIPVAIVLGLLLALAGIPWWIGIVVALLTGGILVALAWRSGFDRALSALGLADQAVTGHARLKNLVEGLSLSVGINEPHLYLIDDPARNALALAQDERAAVVLTTGLVDSLDRIGLEGIVAEVLVSIKNGDAEAATRAAAIAKPFLDGPLNVGPLTKVGKWALSSLVEPGREFRTDASAVAVTRYPPGLADALGKIAQGPRQPKAASLGNDHLWLASPLEAESVLAVSPLEWRIDTLGEF